MTAIQKTIGNTTYYTDGVNYYTYHVISSALDPLYVFAAMDLGITKQSNLTPEEAAKINELAGTTVNHKTKYMLLKNGQAVEMPYNFSKPILNTGDVILRHVPAPSVGTVKCPHCASTVLPGPTCSVCGKPLGA